LGTLICVPLLLCSCSTYQPSVVNKPVIPVTLPTDRAISKTEPPDQLAAEIIVEPEIPTLDQTLIQEEEQTPPEPEQTAAQEVKDLDTLGPWDEKVVEPPPKEKELYDFPVTINRQVEYYLDFFQHKNRRSFRRWLARSGRYLPMIKDHLRAANIPEDLVYLPMIESGYNLTAYSKARAVGPWQFIRSTAVHYGLTVNRYVDERRDPIKSTQAACQYLTDLYSKFNSWPLAVAAYNAGEGKIGKAVRRYKTHDFWEIAKHSYLKSETKRYVPKLTAAIIIAKNPEKYGFSDLKYEQPLEYETTEVPPWTSLRAVALACKTNFKTIQNLNRHLRQSITPPALDSYEIKVPVGKKDMLTENLPRVAVATSTHFKTHIIRNHDTIDKICRKYRISKTTLLKANNLHKAKLRQGHHLRIPYRETKYTLLSKKDFEQQQRLAKAGKDPNIIIHKVRKGETVSKIAGHYHIKSELIAVWNGLPSINKIKAGQKLVIHLNGASYASHQRSASRNIFYNVRGGDSLWTIARKFSTNTANIKRWNNLKNNLIHPGLKLVLKRGEG
jgi:membrane-bound lytic murein transglycosylase D